jgi:hypothetical protein
MEILTVLGKISELGMVALVAGLGAYYGDYLKEKGKNVATHEDIGKLTDQVKAVTQTTKEIEAKISNEVWDRQKRWELKREVLFEVSRKWAAADDALVACDSVLQVEIKQPEVNWAEQKLKATTEWNRVMAELDGAMFLAAIVCSAEVRDAGRALALFARKIQSAITKKDSEIYNKQQNELVIKMLDFQKLIRNELGV